MLLNLRRFTIVDVHARETQALAARRSSSLLPRINLDGIVSSTPTDKNAFDKDSRIVYFLVTIIYYEFASRYTSWLL